MYGQAIWKERSAAFRARHVTAAIFSDPTIPLFLAHLFRQKIIKLSGTRRYRSYLLLRTLLLRLALAPSVSTILHVNLDTFFERNK